MDGQHTLADIQRVFEAYNRPERMKLEDLEAFCQRLLKDGLVLTDAPISGRHLYEQHRKRRFREWLQVLTNVLSIKIPLFDPEKLLTGLLARLRWMFTNLFLAGSLAVILAAVLLVATHFQAFRSKLPDSQEFFNFTTLAYLIAAVGFVKIIHELGHGLTCKAFGGEVHEMGPLLLCLSPSIYCNVSDACMLPDKRKRILIGFAGIHAELLIAALATFLWWYSASEGFLNCMSLSLMVVCSVSTVVFNANPLMRFDGYYVLAEWLEIPALREEANRFVQRLLMDRCLGIEAPPPEPALTRRRKVLFFSFAVASFVYGLTVTFGILWFLYHFLVPYKLGSVGVLLTAVVLGLTVGRPLYGLGKNLHQRGWRLPDMKRQRLGLTGFVAAVLILGFFFVPLPVSRVRESAVVQVQPEAVEKIFVHSPGILKRLHVRDGQRVDKGEILADFASPDLDQQLEEARGEHDVRVVQVEVLQRQLAETTESSKRGRLVVDIAQASGERDAHAARAKVFEQLRQRLVLRAPREGIILSPPRKNEVGKFFDKDQEAPFCSIGALGRLQALVPVAPADFYLLRENLEQAAELTATIRVKGRGADTWPGRVSHLPESEAKEVPLALTQKAGGPLAVKAGTRPNVFEPQEQHYLVTVVFCETDAGVRPGAIGQVKLHCRWKSCAWWLRRLIAQTFDLGLL